MNTLSKLYEKQVSLTEWFESIGHASALALRQEDGEKRKRLDVLRRLIGVPYDEPTTFRARDLVDQPPAFQRFLAEHGDELCALRLIPHDSSLPKLRTRGASIRDSLQWFARQSIDPAQYHVEFVPHPRSHRWSAIFVVLPDRVFGEIIAGGHDQLTQGFYREGEPIAFEYDFQTWRFSREDEGARTHVETVLAMLRVPPDKEVSLVDELHATFSHGYLCGYFETVDSSDRGTWFVDYNQLLATLAKDYHPHFGQQVGGGATLTGLGSGYGRAVGPVRVVTDPAANFLHGEVLVCTMTTPTYVPLMQRASAIVTEQGGILSHAAIIARELGKPCVTGVRGAMSAFSTGEQVEVDGDSGSIRRMSKVVS